MTDRRANDPADYDGREFRGDASRDPEPSNGVTRLFTSVVKGGPWALVVVIVLTWLAGEYGVLESQSKRAADAIKEHSKQAERSQQSLDKIVEVLEEQRRIQAQAALIACFKEAKVDSERSECLKKFPVK